MAKKNNVENWIAQNSQLACQKDETYVEWFPAAFDVLQGLSTHRSQVNLLRMALMDAKSTTRVLLLLLLLKLAALETA